MALNLKNDEYVQCPYENAHRILVSRLQFHLVKCKQVHKNERLVECTFNSTHKIPEPELNCHMKYFCPDRRKVETFIAQEAENAKPLFPVVVVDCPSSESWDNSDCATYDPNTTCENKPVLLNKQGLTPSERKAFRMAERTRHQMYANQSMKSAKAENKENSVRLPQSVSKAQFQCGKAESSGIQEDKPSTSSAKQYTNSTIQSNAADLSLKVKVAETPQIKRCDVDAEGFILPRSSKSRGRGRGRYLPN